uniref:Dynamin-type G domain-containing protein n=1 Tax=Kalanchoe fedtschenkoi TaxID=63787 RepID=A0A7N0UP39_KALFE
MATSREGFLITPTKTTPSTRSHNASARFEAYNRLQSAAVAFGEKLPIPEIVAIGGQSDGKSSLLEALLGFRFNVREIEMGTRRPLILQMVHDPTALDPRCRFQEEDSEDYGSPLLLASAIADTIKSRTETLLHNTKTAVSKKPIVMRAEYAHCPNLTIIDTPGFVLKAKKGEPENTPDEILSMVKSLASPPHRIILFLQQSSVEWCSSLWLDAVREIDPSFKRSIIVVSKFDNRLKEFSDRWEVDRYLSASGYLGENTRPFFVALPKDRTHVSNDEFRRQIAQVDTEVLRHLRNDVKDGFDEEKFRSHIGFSCLREHLESDLQKKYKEAAPATLALLEQRCSDVTVELTRLEAKIQATSDIAQLRKSAMLYATSISNHVGALIDGAADPAPEQWGKTTEEERSESGIGSWPGVTANVRPPNATLRLYGGAAFERVIHEFRCATYSIQCPSVSREKVANILLAHAGRGGSRGLTEAAAEIARAAARSWLAPLLDTACDRLAFVLINLFDLALERSQARASEDGRKVGTMDGDFQKGFNYGPSSFPRSNLASGGSLCLELSDSGASRDEIMKDQENINPEYPDQQTTPSKATDTREALKECQMTVPETPSPDQSKEVVCVGIKKELGNCIEGGARKRQARLAGLNNSDHLTVQGGSYLFESVNNGSKSSSGSAYTEICSLAARHFARIREVLVERSVTSTLNNGFLTPCRDQLVLAIGLDLFAVCDEKFMDMFTAPEAIELLQSERQSLQKRQKTLQSCLNEFKTIARAL